MVEGGVRDGFEKVANGVNDYMRSDKPRTFLQKLGDTLVMVVGWLLKICLVIFAIICSPVLFVFGVVFFLGAVYFKSRPDLIPYKELDYPEDQFMDFLSPLNQKI